ncbi:hypothetical protein EJ04DRAFT_429744 [Polyplosphaeria fusca]|uniref:Thioesterase domain-containing protein n=1 Tax=Polyplosphaeria fusca TaxID=682080 RepID=A0A9P4R7B1_9PLEO|nr:hypothetical protein EJ04DRAFT_429744 [Polyplosphaeria fusca]
MAEAMAHFERTPWCAQLIQSPDWTPTRTASRVPKPTSEDSFFAETLGTQRTIRNCLTLRPTKEEVDGPVQYKEVRTLMDLGSGLNGHPHICHGGFVATVLDEGFGVLLTLNLGKKMQSRPHESMNTFTAYLTTNYKKPVPTPGIIMCTARFIRQERNKTYVEGTIEDGMGTVYTTGEAMFVEVKTKL